MGHFIYEDEIDRIEFGEDWVDIKKRMSYGDQQRLTAHYMKVQTQLEQLAKGEADIALDIESGNLELLFINIIAWSFKGRDNEPAPITREMVFRLDSKIAKKLISELAKRNPSPKA